MIRLKHPDNDDTEYWYRYKDVSARSRRSPRTNGVDKRFDLFTEFNASIIREEFPVMKHTPKGVVLDIGMRNPRFVLDGTRKQYAHPDDKDALTSFMYRKRAQRRILRNQIDQTESALIVGQEKLSKMP
jgi:hypothetical protein